MAEDTKQPGSETPTTPDASGSDSSGTPPPSSIPNAGQLAGADGRTLGSRLQSNDDDAVEGRR